MRTLEVDNGPAHPLSSGVTYSLCACAHTNGSLNFDFWALLYVPCFSGWLSRGGRTGSKGRLLIKILGVILALVNVFSRSRCDFWTQHHQFRETSSQISCKEQIQEIGMLISQQLIGDLLTLSYLLCWLSTPQHSILNWTNQNRACGRAPLM